MGNRRFIRPGWLLGPVMLFFLLLSGCSLHGLLGKSDTTSPAEATVTAIVQAAANNPKCVNKTGTSAPTLDALLVSNTSNNPSPTGVFGHTTVTLVGTCWIGDHSVFIATVAQGPNGTRTIVPLTGTTTIPPTGTAATPPPEVPLKTSIKSDGTFRIDFQLAADWSVYTNDTRLALIAYSDNYLQMAATTIEVTST